MTELTSSQKIDHEGDGAKNNAAIAWLVAAFCLSTAGVRWFSAEGTFNDGVFGVALAGAAAVLAFTLRRRLLFALRCCRRVAFVSGVVNGLLLQMVLTTAIVGLMVGPAASAGDLPREMPATLCVAMLAALAPWGVYYILREERVRVWCATHSAVV